MSTFTNAPTILRGLLLLSGIFFSQAGWAQFQGNVDVIHNLERTSGQFGWAVSELSDVDLDGVSDLIVGSRSSQDAIVFSGRTGAVIHELNDPDASLGFAVADAGDTNIDGIADIISGSPLSGTGRVSLFSGSDGSLLWQVDGDNSGDRFGAAVASAGDINGDGRSDVLIGADTANASGTSSGAVFVLSGTDGQTLRTYSGGSAGDRFGSAVDSVRDLTGDGRAEHVVGAFKADSAGRAYIYDGATGNLLFELQPDSGSANFGQFFVAGLDDVNNDGWPDIYVGDYGHNGNNGRAYVFSGADQSVIHRFDGGAGEGAGPGRGAGDVDGDGHEDIIVGFYTSSAGSFRAGRVSVFSGADGSVLEQFVHTLGQTNLGFDAVGIGDVNADNRVDFLLSAANGNRVYVVAGSTARLTDFTLHPGLNGSWFNPETAGQGFFLDIFPEREEVFLAWFTHDTSLAEDGASSNVGDPNHRWLTAQGPFTDNTADLTFTLTRDGLFDNPRLTENLSVGTAVLTFSGCASGQLEYSLDRSGLTGAVPLRRLSDGNLTLCDALTP